MKLAICVPTYDRWEAEFGASLALTMVDLAVSGKLESIRLIRSDGSIASDGRNDLIRDALDKLATHILWCDTDMQFRPEVVWSLISRDLVFVAADYLTRLPPNKSIAKDMDGNPVKVGEGIVEVLQCGLGLTLMRTEMIGKMTYPWSGFMTHDTGTLDDSVWLCRNARNAGYKLFVDQHASRGTGHVGKHIYRIG
ncbi:MAG: hypothetical protein Q7S17_00905 [Xanthobacteraceae bacterium]|nr:hypothetical protein [Xanthobacteraceae bacterium]